MAPLVSGSGSVVYAGSSDVSKIYLGTTENWPKFDADAQAYIDAVQAADGQVLEYPVRAAYNDFVLGCKSDGIWAAIKASCIMAGARTLAGALTPLVGTAPTNNNFVAGDYNRKTGLVGDGSTKYLDSNRANDSDPQDNNHNALYATTVASSPGTLIGAWGQGTQNTNFMGASTVTLLFTRNRSTTGTQQAYYATAGFLAHSRSTSGSYSVRGNSTTNTVSVTSGVPEGSNVLIYRRNVIGDELYGAHRLSFYSIGESLDLALLDSRVTTLMADIAAAIP